PLAPPFLLLDSCRERVYVKVGHCLPVNASTELSTPRPPPQPLVFCVDFSEKLASFPHTTSEPNKFPRPFLALGWQRLLDSLPLRARVRVQRILHARLGGGHVRHG